MNSDHPSGRPDVYPDARAARGHHVVFRLDVPHGRCVGVEIADGNGPLAGIDPAEQAHAAGFGPTRRAAFHAGRFALRAALADLGLAAGAMLPDERGAPRVPGGALGSISHKRTRAVGLAARPGSTAPADAETIEEIGVDLEELRPLRANIAPRVLTPAECESWQRLPPGQRDRFVLERFSLKESFFKAVNRVVGPRISFQAVAITAIADDGAAEVHAPWLEERGFLVQGWLGSPESGLILSSVRMRSSGFGQPSGR